MWGSSDLLTRTIHPTLFAWSPLLCHFIARVLV